MKQIPRRPLVALSILLISACAAPILPGTAVSGEPDEDCVIEKDVSYLGPDRSEKLDVYLPKKAGATPLAAILLIHGGGWSKGDKADQRESGIARELAANGYAVFSINYLLEKTEKDENGKGRILARCWPQNIQDCKSALQFMSHSAKRFNIDPNRVAIMGLSAGAHLALLTGLTSDEAALNPAGFSGEQIPKPVCLVSFYGVMDVRSFASYHFSGDDPGQRTANLDLASPILHLAQTSPPVFVAHGSADKTVPVAQSQAFAGRLKELNIEHEYIEIPGAPHSFSLDYPRFDIRTPLLAFLKKHLPATQGTTNNAPIQEN